MEFHFREDYNSSGLHTQRTHLKVFGTGLGRFMQGLLLVFIILLAVVFLAVAVYSFKVFNRLQTALRQAGLKITVYPFAAFSLIAGLVAGLAVFLLSGSMTAALMAAAAVTAAPSIFALDKRRRR